MQVCRNGCQEVTYRDPDTGELCCRDCGEEIPKIEQTILLGFALSWANDAVLAGDVFDINMTLDDLIVLYLETRCEV